MKLSALRKQKKLTQKQLGDRIGVSQRAIASYEAAERRPSPEIALKLAEVFGWDTETMWKVLYAPDQTLTSP